MLFCKGIQVTPDMNDMKVNCRILSAPIKAMSSPMLSPTSKKILNAESSQGSDVSWMPSQSDDSEREEVRHVFVR